VDISAEFESQLIGWARRPALFFYEIKPLPVLLPQETFRAITAGRNARLARLFIGSSFRESRF